VGPNSLKPIQTGLEEVSATAVLRRWVDQVGGNQRIPQVLDLLAEYTVQTLQAGHPSPALDADTLRQLYIDKYGGRMPEMPASRWLPSTSVRRWWDQRREQLAQACRQARLPLIPELTTQSGGGRGNTTQYRLDFRPLSAIDDLCDEGETANGPSSPRLIGYQSESAKSSWWLRPIIGTMPFRMRSWRGYLLLGMTLAEAFALLALWVLLLLGLRGSRPIQVADLGLLVTVPLITWTWWHFMQPLIRLPINRVTIANDLFLGWSQLNGQFRLIRDAKSKVAGGWFQFVRHHATCPICSGEVEIADGGDAFPGRLVGRCGDSPLEHVFSFDPVSLSGRILY
jgi:hypothetical protein